MSIRFPYKSLDNFIKSEAFEPRFNWGVRMAIISIVPLVYGIATGNVALAEWVTLTAQSIAWIELKGSPGIRLRVLSAGMISALFFGLLGNFTGNIIWLSMVGMLITSVFASLCRNLGDRGNGLAVSAFILFIIANAYPAKTMEALQERVFYIFIGGIWSMVVGLLASAFVPERQPYRRAVAVVWKAVAELIETLSKGWDGETIRSTIREIYQKEKEVRTSLDSSFQFYSQMAHQVNKKDGGDYQLAQIRKTTALVASHVLAMNEELETLKYKTTSPALRLRLFTLFRAIQQTCDRMAVFLITLKPEELTILNSRIERIRRLIVIIEELPLEDPKEVKVVARLLQLADRVVKLIESGVNRLQKLGDDTPTYMSYSLQKTLFILHPKYLFRNLRTLFNLNTFMVKYALRNAAAAIFAIFLYKWFNIDHGYWIPLTVLIVAQPYFGATFKKAIDRMVGTVLGGITASMLLHIPDFFSWMGFERFPFSVLQVIILTVSCVMMVYYVRKKYAYTAFYVTIWLVFLFAFEKVNMTAMDIVLIRAACTLGGSLIAVVAGFALLPDWDSKLLPETLSAAIAANYAYFLHSFYQFESGAVWTKLKREAETENSNAFDSYSRYIQEPNSDKRLGNLYFQILTHNIRITRELNNFHIEEDAKADEHKKTMITAEQEVNIREGAERWMLLNECVARLMPFGNKSIGLATANRLEIPKASSLTAHQNIYIDKLNIELKAMRQELERLEKEMAHA